MPEFNSRQTVFANIACGPYTKHRERIHKFRETGNLKHLYRSILDKVCFAHDVAYSDSKDLAKRNIPDKVLKERAYEIARNPKYDRYQRALASMVYKFFWQKSKIKNKIKCKEELVKEQHKPVIKKFKKEESMQYLKTISAWQI